MSIMLKAWRTLASVCLLIERADNAPLTLSRLSYIQLFCRDDLEEAEVETGAKFGAIALERLERLHAKRRENKLDATERDFEEVQKVVTTTTHFAMAYAERISSDENRLEHLLAQASCSIIRSMTLTFFIAYMLPIPHGADCYAFSLGLEYL